MAMYRPDNGPVARTLAVALLTSVLALSAPATHAETPSVQSQYDAGKQALKDGAPEQALTHFKEALVRSDGSRGITWQLLLAVALTYQDLDRLVAAHEYFKRFLTVTEKHRDLMPRKWLKRRELVKGDLDQLEAQLDKTHALVMVRSTPSGAALSLDGERAGADGDATAPCPLYVAPGEHTLSASLDGHKTASRTLPLAKGSMVTVELLLEASDEPVAPLKPVSAQPPPVPVEATVAVEASDTSGPGSGPWWVIGGAGAAAVGGVLMTVLGELSAQDLEEKGAALADGPDALTNPGQAIDDYQALESEMNTYRTVGYVLYGVAGAAAIGGILWLGLSGDDPQDPEDLTIPSIDVVPGRGGAAVYGTWSF